MSLSSLLYKAARTLGKTSSTIKDIEVLASGDPKKITKRLIRKGIYKTSNKVAKTISDKL